MSNTNHTEILHLAPAVIDIDIAEEDGHALNPRGPVRSSSDLQDSIAQSGIIDPLVVRRVTDDDGTPKYVLVHGHRRLHAAMALDLSTVPCAISDVGDPLEAMLAAGLSKDYPDIVLDRDCEIVGGWARAIKMLYDRRVEESGNTRGHYGAIGEIVGKSGNVVSAFLKLHNAPDAVKESIASGRMGITAYARMMTLPEERQVAIIADARETRDGDVTVSHIRDAIAEDSDGTNPTDSDATDITDIIQSVEAALMAISLMTRTGQAQITPMQAAKLDELSDVIDAIRDTSD